ncbi:MAG: hypothetical protein IPO17_01040 [Flavobacteriales bacterium]|nr:hypothetical protein [Flavobacteriales bacterium]
MAKKTIYWTLASSRIADHVRVKTPLKLFISGTWQKQTRQVLIPSMPPTREALAKLCLLLVRRTPCAGLDHHGRPRVLRAQGTFSPAIRPIPCRTHMLCGYGRWWLPDAGPWSQHNIARADLALMKVDAMGGMQWSKRWSTVSSSDRPLVVGLSGSGALVLS